MLNALKLVRNDVENCKFFDYLVTSPPPAPFAKRFCFICVALHLWPPPKVCCNLLHTLVINMHTYAVTHILSLTPSHTHTHSRKHLFIAGIQIILKYSCFCFFFYIYSVFNFFATNVCICICGKFNEFLRAIDGCQLCWLYSAIAWDSPITLSSVFPFQLITFLFAGKSSSLRIPLEKVVCVNKIIIQLNSTAIKILWHKFM